MKWTLFNKIPIKYRIVIIIALAQVMLLSIVLHLVSAHFYHVQKTQQSDNVTLLGNTLSKTARIALENNDFQSIQSVIDIMSANHNIEKIILLNKNNNVLASNQASEYSTQPVFRNSEFKTWVVLPIIDVTSTVSANQSGIIAVQFSSFDLALSKQKTGDFLFVVTLLSVIFISAIAFLLGNSLSIRIKKLRFAATSIATGCKIENIDAAGNDELTELCRAFNQMAERIRLYIENLRCNQQQLLQAQNSLEQRIIDRTEQLAVARDHALDANKTKSQFLANMSHELRTPLNAIIGYSELLTETAEPNCETSYVDDLDKIRHSGTHLLVLINQILDLSKIEAGKAELFVEKIGIKQIVYEAMINIKPIMDKNNNSIKLNLTDEIKNIETDRTKLVQILINLLQNAAKFTHDGKILFSVTSYNDNNQNWLNFSVQDSGIGIDNSKFKKLFSEFSQADNSTTHKYGGSGLGLAICKSFSNLMGGDVSVKSEINVGSTFTLSLPQNIFATNKTQTKNTFVSLHKKSA